MNIISFKIISANYFMIFVLVLFDPARSADPPIIIFFFSFNAVRIFSEDFLVANVSKFLIAFCFSFLKISEKFIEKILSI